MKKQKELVIFGELLRDTRKAKGLSQEDLADVAGFDRTFISRLERGLTQPSLTSLLSIADALGLPAHSLIKKLESKL